MIMTNTDTIDGYKTEIIGLVQGSTVQSKNMFKDMGAGFKNMVGGELKSYTKMMTEARDIAINRMLEQANNMGADAVVCVRFSSASITQGAAEIMAYGTAVKLTPID